MDLGPAGETLFHLTGPTAVSAGAGSGKTTALVELVVRLLDGRATGEVHAPGELAAITFTEKAALELRQRVRGALVERVRSAALSGDALAHRAWLERLHGLEAMVTLTIHGYCGRILREHAPEAGLDPEFEVVDEERASAWLRAAAREAVVAALDQGRPLTRTLSAAPGAGTRGLSGSIAGLVRERATRGDEGPVSPAEGDPTEAVRARGTLLRAAEAASAEGGGAASPHPAALARAVGSALASLRPQDREGPVTAASLLRLEALGEAAQGRVGRGAPALLAARDALKAAAEEFRLQAAEVLAAPQRAEIALLVRDAEERYAARKRAARAVDFDDLLVRTRDLLLRDAALRAEVRGGLRALLVDEYQDVNPVQHAIVEILCRVEPGEGRAPLLFAVGDLKQSIYRFRGADVSVFARLLKTYGGGAGRVLHLSENHRSAPAVLDLVNAVSERALRPPPGALPRDDEIAFGQEDRLVPRRPEGARPACELIVDGDGGSAAERRGREALAIAARIGQIVSGRAGILVRERGAQEGPGSARPPRHGEIAVLFRRLTQLGPYERALREAGIPYRLARGGGFYQASEVRDVGELCAALSDAEDAVAWAALLRSPFCAVSDGSLFLLARVGLTRLHRLAADTLDGELAALPGGGAGEGLLPPSLPPDERERLHLFLSVYRELSALRDRLPLGELLSRAVSALWLDAALLAGTEGERRAANLEKVLRLAAEAARAGSHPAEFAAHLRAMASRPPREPEADLEAKDAVALLTVHQSKGLEWPVVFVPDLGARLPADARPMLFDPAGRLCTAFFDPVREEALRTASLVSAREVERRSREAESRRLLYVALTRARDHLVLSGEGNGDSWRALVEGALAGPDPLARRVPIAEIAEGEEGREEAEGGGAAVGPGPRLSPPAPLRVVRMAATDLAEYARCPRRDLFGRVLRIPEPRGARTPPADDPARATSRGTLAHAMLSEVDLSAPPLERRAQLEAVASRRGYDPRGPGVRRILGEVLGFSDSAAGQVLVRAAREDRLSREVPFLLRLGGEKEGTVYLVGILDALVRSPRGELTVVDYKYMTPRPEAAARYRLQLAAYALAAERAHPGRRVRATLQFLRGDQRTVDLTPTPAELKRLEELAPRLALEAAVPREESPSALGREVGLCRAEGCGYVERCFGRVRRGGE
ncbi:MAG TPA: UvrD-helicase domain-containing protein [Anaeromyxobacter sp.]|nr:UvrD-helicase domain-containing protein [Anaeromyxobacter sp.]